MNKYIKFCEFLARKFRRKIAPNSTTDGAKISFSIISKKEKKRKVFLHFEKKKFRSS